MAFDPESFVEGTDAIATTFADPIDIQRFQQAKARGASDQEAFAVGDNGVGKWGDNTTTDEPMAALPRDQAGADHNRMVEVTSGDRKVVARIADQMPSSENIRNGAGIDLNPAAADAIGSSGKTPVSWRFVDNKFDPAKFVGETGETGNNNAFDPAAFVGEEPSPTANTEKAVAAVLPPHTPEEKALAAIRQSLGDVGTLNETLVRPLTMEVGLKAPEGSPEYQAEMRHALGQDGESISAPQTIAQGFKEGGVQGALISAQDILMRHLPLGQLPDKAGMETQRGQEFSQLLHPDVHPFGHYDITKDDSHAMATSKSYFNAASDLIGGLVTPENIALIVATSGLSGPESVASVFAKRELLQAPFEGRAALRLTAAAESTFKKQLLTAAEKAVAGGFAEETLVGAGDALHQASQMPDGPEKIQTQTQGITQLLAGGLMGAGAGAHGGKAKTEARPSAEPVKGGELLPEGATPVPLPEPIDTSVPPVDAPSPLGTAEPVTSAAPATPVTETKPVAGATEPVKSESASPASASEPAAGVDVPVKGETSLQTTIKTNASDLPIHDPSDNVTRTLQAHSDTPAGSRIETVPMDDIKTGGTVDQQVENDKVTKLVGQMQSEGGHIARIIVDADNNVVEGQHRLEALRKLGATEVPVVKIFGAEDVIPDVPKLKTVLQDAGLRRDHVNQLVSHIGEILMDEKGNVNELHNYDAPQGYEKQWKAAVDEVARQHEAKTTDPVAAGRTETPADAGTSPVLGEGTQPVASSPKSENAARPVVGENAPAPAPEQAGQTAPVAEAPVVLDNPDKPVKLTTSTGEPVKMKAKDALQQSEAEFELLKKLHDCLAA